MQLPAFFCHKMLSSVHFLYIYIYIYIFFFLKKIRLTILNVGKKKDVQKTDTILIIQRKNYTVSLHISTSTELVYNRLI